MNHAALLSQSFKADPHSSGSSDLGSPLIEPGLKTSHSLDPRSVRATAHGCADGCTTAVLTDIIISPAQTESCGACPSLFLPTLCPCCQALSCLFKVGVGPGEPATGRTQGSLAGSTEHSGHRGSERPDRREEAHLEEENAKEEWLMVIHFNGLLWISRECPEELCPAYLHCSGAGLHPLPPLTPTGAYGSPHPSQQSPPPCLPLPLCFLFLTSPQLDGASGRRGLLRGKWSIRETSRHLTLR
ncbi:hypothetical protein SKAU_G00129990 [Synaphobranchus kaupii]|uniref:Uncharacterized protein n=1 Tax=Synaphobranchus kaupii TaxID=118154 RepID=A0A9Q1FQE0_SYNKA|nr:hypothetical protein SKAU_G00129990 [Synaphobranchus kaupii]